MKTRPLAVALLLSLAPAVAFPPRAAFAQAQADDTTTRMARQRFQEGVAFFDKHQYEQARGAFLQAYALRKHPVVLLNLAQSSLKSGHALEAARYFQTFLKDYPSAANRGDAESGLAEAHTKLGRVDVSSAPSGAEISVDNDRVGVAPLDHPIEVEPGMHSLRARGRNDETLQVDAAAGQIVTARFGSTQAVIAAPPPVVPTPAPAPTPPPEEPPPAAAEPPPAPAPEAAPSTEAPATESHRSFFPSNMTPVVLGTVLAVAGFGTAVVFAVEKGTAQNSADSVAQQIVAHGGVQGTCSTSGGHVVPANLVNACGVLSSDDDKVNTDALIANIGLGVGIGATALTVAYFAFASRGDSTAPPAGSFARPVVTPMFGRGLGGVMLGGAF